MKAKFLVLFLIILLQSACTDKNAGQLNTNHAQNNTKANTASTTAKYTIDLLDNTAGLSNSSINCIFQDSQNMLWIGTWDGLNRFDGTNFKIFRPQPDKNSLSNQVVLKIGEDNQGQIWILTMHGINCYNKKTDTFRHFYFSTENNPPVSESQFNLAFDDQQNVFCAVKDWGIGYFDGSEFQRLTVKGLPAKAVKKLEFLTTDKLLVLYDDNTLYSLSVKNLQNGEKALSGISKLQANVSTFSKINNSATAIVAMSGQAALLSANGTTTNILKGKKVEDIVGRVPGGLLLSCKSGYTVIDNTGNEIQVLWQKHLIRHKVTTVIQGNENIVWAGTDGDGILKIAPVKKSFNLISGLQMPELDGGIVRSFLKDSTNFWVATKGKGLFKLPANFYHNTEKKPGYVYFNEDNSKLNNSVYALSKGGNNLVLAGTDGEGITVYDNDNAKLVSWHEIEGTEKAGHFKSVYAIFTDDSGFTWLGTNGYGLIRFKLVKNNGSLKIINFKKYTANANNKHSLSSNIIYSIIPKNKTQLWIGTRLGGLNLFDTISGKFYAYKNNPADPESLSSNDILCLVTDAENRLWIGTSYGLNVLEEPNGNKPAFKSYTVKDGLPNNTIHGIVPVKSNLWISTSFGLSNFSIGTSKFTNYTKNEGLQNNEFADGAYYNDKTSGFIFMGGIKGFNYFLPEKIKESAALPDLLIDKISGQNQSLPYYQGLVISPGHTIHPSITLKHNQNFFDIHLRALTYTNSEKCRYAYRLEGFDEEWNDIGNRQVISFTNVPKGSYSLWLKWSNSEGVWTKPVQAVAITIKPVWWQSNLALTLYVILGVLFILFVRSYNLKRQSLRQNILIRKNEEELHENKLTFFTNVAHEFLTPLTLIVGPAQKLSESANLDGKNSKYMHMIQRNASRLLFLTQQLLEFRKAEHEYLQNSVKNFDLVGLVEQIAELFDDWAIDKNISYTLTVPSSLPGWYDKDKLEKIIFNLMSNAFKYTPLNGKIHLQCSTEHKEHSVLNITIRNTGKGIPKEKLDSLFDRFFLTGTNHQSDTEMFRTGIGLAYVKRLVSVLRGEIVVISEPDAETVFTILIPCDKEAFNDKEIDPENSPVFISGHLKNILEESSDKSDPIPQKISALEAVETQKKKILIAEDENEIHAYLKSLLAEHYDIISTFNGAEALEIVNKEIPDLIISDVMMPEMDGVELCRHIKTNVLTCHIPFIMLTAKSSVAHRIEGLESGANSYIPKPFYPDHLLVRIQKLLEEKELILKHFTQDTLVDNLPTIPIDNDEKSFIKSVIELVRKNIDSETLDSKFIEKALGISESQLYRKAKDIFGLAPGDLIRTIKLKHAAELLRKDVLTVSEICYKSGFNNRSYFYREFKKVYNTTPKNYQLQYRDKSRSF